MYQSLEAVIADFEKEAKLPKKGSCAYHNIFNIIIPSAEEIKELDITPIIKNSLANGLNIKTKDYNIIDIEVGECIAAIVKGQTELEHCTLHIETMSIEAIKPLVDVLKNHPTIDHIRLEMGSILFTDECFDAFVDMARENYNLEHIHIAGGNPAKHLSVMANISNSKQAVREEIKDVLKCLDPNKAPKKIEKLIPAIKFYQTFNTDLLKLDAGQHNKINDFIQNTFFYLTAVCKNNSLLGDDIDGSVLPQAIWSNIFSYLDISDVVEEGNAVALSGSCDDML